MENSFQILFLIGLFVLFSCSESVDKRLDAFTKKKAQTSAERTIQDLTPTDSLNITQTFNGRSFEDIKEHKASIIAKVSDQILKLNKQDLSTEKMFTVPEGRGPGEIINFNVVMYDVEEGGIAIHDKKAKKTVLYNLNGNFREEFMNGTYSVSNMAMANEQTYYFQVIGGDSLFFEVRRNESQSVVRRRFQQTDNIKMLVQSGGHIEYNNQSLYFGGYSEPLIRRYDLSGEKPKLVFSRAVIDDYDSKKNYQKPQRTSGGGRMYGFTDQAQYASDDIAVDDNYLYSVRHHNSKEGYKYLDIYAIEDGSYIGSFALPYYPKEVAIDDHHIYTIEVAATSTPQIYLMKYAKPEIDF
jgi:hypothetical protein